MMLFLYPFYIFSFIVPRKKNVWIFGNHFRSFSDNSKYLFLYVVNNRPEIEAVWISRSRIVIRELRDLGFKAYLPYSFQGIKYGLRAKVYFFTNSSADINFWTSGKALKVNLWHGIPLKRIRYDVVNGFNGKKYNSRISIIYKFLAPWEFEKPDFLLSSSRQISKIFCSAFRINTHQCLNYNYPRCELFFSKLEIITEHIRRYEHRLAGLIERLDVHKKKIIYLPTFRDRNMQNRSLNLSVDLKLDLDDLNDSLIKNNYLLLIKLHPFVDWKFFNRVNYENILILDNKCDIYPVLPFIDILITDYSSIIFDFALLRKPIILYQHDIDDYKKERGDLYFDKLRIGPIAKSYAELKSYLFDVELETNYDSIISEFWNNEIPYRPSRFICDQIMNVIDTYH